MFFLCNNRLINVVLMMMIKELHMTLALSSEKTFFNNLGTKLSFFFLHILISFEVRF